MRDIAKTVTVVLFAAFALIALACAFLPAAAHPLAVQAQAECGTIASIRAAVASNGGVEVAYLEGDRARALFVATGAPERSAAAGLFAPSRDHPAVMIVLFDAAGCAFAQGVFDRDRLAGVINGQVAPSPAAPGPPAAPSKPTPAAPRAAPPI